MPNPELSTLVVRQISQFPSVSTANPGDALLMQTGGLGGPYVTVAAANLVATALANAPDSVMQVAGDLEVFGDHQVSGDFEVIGNTSLQGQLNVGGAGVFAAEGGFSGNAAVGGDLNVGGNLNVEGAGVFAAEAGFSGDVVIDGDAAIVGQLQVRGATVLGGGMSMSGPLYVSGAGSFVGDLMSGGGVSAGGNALFGGGAKFGGGISTAGSVTVDGGVGMRECLSVGQDAVIGGSATLGSLQVNGDSCLAGHLGVTGNLDVGNGNFTLGGNFTAMGITTLQAGALDVTGDMCIAGNLGVAGIINAGSAFFKESIVTAGNAVIEGSLTVAKNALFCGPVRIDNDLTVNGRVGISGFLHLNGEAVATEMWTRGYVCHVGSDLLDAITTATHELRDEIRAELNDENSDMMEFISRTFAPINSPQFTGIPQAPNPSPYSNSQQIATTQWVKGLIVEGVAGVASFNGRGGHVELSSDDIEHANGILRPTQPAGNWYAWRDGQWTAFELGVPEPTSPGLWGRFRNGGTAWEAVAPRPPSNTNWYAWRNGSWASFEPGGGAGGGIDDVPSGTTQPQARISGAWQPTVPQPPGTDGSYYALRDGAWASFTPDGGGGGGGVTPEDLTAALANYLPRAGGTMTGAITLPADGTGSQAIRYSQLATQLANYLPLAGGALSGQITLPSDGSGSQAVRYSQLINFATTAALNTATADMATQTWTSGQISTATSGLVTTSAMTTAIGAATTGMATQSWASGQFLSLGGGSLNGALNIPGSYVQAQTLYGTNLAYAYGDSASPILCYNPINFNPSYPNNTLTLVRDPTANLEAATKQYVDSRIAAIPTTNTLQFSFVVPGKPAAGQTYNVPVTIEATLSSDSFANNSQTYLGTLPAAVVLFTVNKVSGGTTTKLGNVRSNIGGTITYPDGALPANFAPGDILQLVAPSPQDASLADVGISFQMTRT